MRSKLCATTTLTPSSRVPLAAQSRELPVPYSAPASTISGVPCFGIFDSGVENAHLLAAGLEFGHPAFHSRHHQIFDADVGKCAARHDAVVAAARTVAVEVHKINAADPPDTCRRAMSF